MRFFALLCQVASASLVFSVSAISLDAQTLVFPPYGHSYGIRKATPKHLFMFFGPRTSFNDPQGLAATRLKSWDDPKTRKDDDEVTVYGVNSGRHEIIFNTSMWALGLYGSKGSGKDRFLFPKGVAANELGHVFVADSGNNRVVHLFNPKSKLSWRRAFTVEPKNGAVGLRGPSRVAVDEQCLVYVTDPGNARLVVFDTNGTVIRTIPPAGQKLFEDGPTALAFADGRARYSYFDHERIIFCADRAGRRVWKIAPDGTVMAKADLPQGKRASYGAIDYYHNYWISDTYSHSLVKFDHNLRLLEQFGSYGEGDNQFVEPRGITFYKRFGQVFIAEKKGAQYFWVGSRMKSASLAMSDAEPSLTIAATEYSYVSLFTTKTTDTTFYVKRHLVFPGQERISIPLSKDLKEISNVGLRIEPTYSSYTYYAWFYRSGSDGVFR